MKLLVAMLVLATVAVTLTPALPVAEDEHYGQHPLVEESARPRRSPDDKNKSPGSWGVDVYEQDKVGVVGKVHGRGTVWQSDDGKSRVEAHGQWSKVFDGPQRGKPQHSGGISFSHDFGDD